MVRFVAFLRGINVGGRVARKETLQAAFTSLGLANVLTFKQSGNIIFDATDSNRDELKRKIEAKLLETLGYAVPVFLRTLPELKNIVEKETFKNQKSEGSSFLVTFLPQSPRSLPFPLPHTIPKSTALVIAAEAAEVFSVTHGGGEGALPNPFLEAQLKVKATTRNLNVLCLVVEKYSTGSL